MRKMLSQDSKAKEAVLEIRYQMVQGWEPMYRC